MTLYAHSKEGLPEDQWQPLDEHLKGVAELAQGMAEAFGAGPWGRAAITGGLPFSWSLPPRAPNP